jgi:UPF0716 protein FxsA
MFLLVVLFIVVPIAELYVIIQVGEAIGVVPTLLLLLLDAIAGSLLLRHQGRGAWRRFNEALAQRRFPGREVADGVLIVIGGTLLLTPGFLTDIVGVFLLVPPTRALSRALLKRFTLGRFTVVGVSSAGGFGRGPFGGPGAGTGGTGANRDYDYDVTAEEMPSNGNGAGRELPRVDED